MDVTGRAVGQPDPVQELYNIVVTARRPFSASSPSWRCATLHLSPNGGGQLLTPGWRATKPVSMIRLLRQMRSLTTRRFYTADSNITSYAPEAPGAVSRRAPEFKSVPITAKQQLRLFDAPSAAKTSESAAADRCRQRCHGSSPSNALPAADAITLGGSCEAVTAARAALDALTEAQQAFCPQGKQPTSWLAAEAAIAAGSCGGRLSKLRLRCRGDDQRLPARGGDITLENSGSCRSSTRRVRRPESEAQSRCHCSPRRPQDKLTACEARIAELEKPDETRRILPFTDLTQDWYMDSIRYVYEHELMYGTRDTTFARTTP